MTDEKKPDEMTDLTFLLCKLADEVLKKTNLLLIFTFILFIIVLVTSPILAILLGLFYKFLSLK